MLYRIEGVLDLETVRKTRIAFVGLGSLGSLTLSNLAYPWKRIELIDQDVLSNENLERHLLGKDLVGLPKAMGLEIWYKTLGFDTIVLAKNQRVENTGIFDVDLVVVTTGTGHAPHFVNISAGPISSVVYAGVFPRGIGGQIVSVPKGASACYLCAQHFLGRDYDFPDVAPNYGVTEAQLENNHGQINAVPALRWSVNLVAAHCAKMALRLIDGQIKETQVQIFANSWQPRLILPKGGLRRKVRALVESQEELGLIPNLRLDNSDEGLVLEVSDSTLTFRVPRWEDCPFHAEREYSAEEI